MYFSFAVVKKESNREESLRKKGPMHQFYKRTVKKKKLVSHPCIKICIFLIDYKGVVYLWVFRVVHFFR